MRKHEVLVGEFDTEHRPGEHRGDLAFCFNCIIYTHKGTTDGTARGRSKLTWRGPTSARWHAFQEAAPSGTSAGRRDGDSHWFCGKCKEYLRADRKINVNDTIPAEVRPPVLNKF